MGTSFAVRTDTTKATIVFMVVVVATDPAWEATVGNAVVSSAFTVL